MNGPTAPFAPGSVVAEKYRLERLIGEGGMGEVYAAFDSKSDRRVALKVLRRQLGGDKKVVGRFMREARVAARLESSHVARLHDFGVSEAHGVLFVVFELLEGEDLSKALKREGPAPIATCVDRTLEALAGLASAHMEGIVHRDLKPENLFRVVLPNGEEIIKVLDFGIAKAVKGGELLRGPQTSTSALVGSPLYMSPEQLRSSKDVDMRTDIWSIGATLYELLTGRPPFEPTSFGELIKAVMDGRVTPPDRHRPEIPQALAAAVLRCLQPDREDRYASVLKLAIALGPFATDRGRIAMTEIEDHFSSETAKNSFEEMMRSSPSLPELPTASGQHPAAPAQPAPPRANESPARQRRPAQASGAGIGVWIGVAAAAVVLLVVAALIGFRFAGP